MRTFSTIALAMLLALQAQSQSTSVNTSPFVTDKQVKAILTHQGTTFIGGEFNYVGPQTPYGTALRASNGQPVDIVPATAAVDYFPKPNGAVHVAVADGSGGWYIGGAFTSIGGTPRNRLARINRDGSLHGWNPDANNPVHTITVSGSTVYLGGEFTSIKGSARNRLAAVDNTDGTPTSWDPNANGTVRAIAVSGNTIYVGGDFNGSNSIGSNTRNYLAAFTSSSSTPISWNPDANGTVRAIAVGSFTVMEGDPLVEVTKTLVYVGGDFTGIGGAVDRNRIASFEIGSDGITHTLTNWNPNANARVKAITVSGSYVYVGGEFTSIAGSGRRMLAAFNKDATGALANWAPSIGTSDRNPPVVNAITVTSSEVIAGGFFRTFDLPSGGVLRMNIVATITADASPVGGSHLSTTWKGASSEEVYALAASDTSVYVGGAALSYGGQNRKRLASLTASGTQLTDWEPYVVATLQTWINAFAVDVANKKLYVGGVITGINMGTTGYGPFNGLAAFDITNPNNPQVVAGWMPALSKGSGDVSVYALAILGNNLIAGGDFISIGGNTRRRVAGFNRSTGELLGWDAAIADGEVYTLAVSGTKLYLGGAFSTVGANTSDFFNMAAFDGSTAVPSLTNWRPRVSGGSGWAGSVRSIAISSDGGTVYVGGDFVQITPSPTGTPVSRISLAAIDASSAAATTWQANANREVNSLLLSGNVLYVAGTFNKLSTCPSCPTSSGKEYQVSNLGAVYTNLNTENAVEWNPGLQPITWLGTGGTALGIVGTDLFVGGEIVANNSTTMYLASYALPSVSVAWGGSSGGNWDEVSNWSPQVVPTSSTDAIEIAQGYPILNTDFIVGAPTGTTKRLTISGSGSLEIAAGYRFSVAATGTADFGGKSVTLRSTADGTASIGQVLGTLSNASNVTVERYIPAGRKWRMLTAPLKEGPTDIVTGQPIRSIYANWQRNGTSNGTHGVEIWGPSGGGSSGMATGPANSLLSFNNGWVNVNNTNDALLFDGTTNNAYALFVTAPYGGGNIATGAAATTLSATGTLITGDHTKSFSGATAGRYFLVGNPYASPVDPMTFTGSNVTNIDNILYMWDAKQTGTGNVGRYVSFSISTGLYSMDGGEGSIGYPAGTQIQSGQAFFVRATASGQPTTSLVFKETSKSTSSSHAMFGNSATEGKKYVRVQLKRDNEVLDGVIAFFEPNASAAVDALDGVKLMNSSENLGLSREGKTLVFEHRPELKSADTLYIALTQMRQASYKLSLRCFGITAEEGVSLELVDNYTQQRRDLSVTQANEVEFIVDAQGASSGDRYLIVLKKKAAAAGATTEPAFSAKMKPYPNPVTGPSPVRIEIDRERAPWSIRLVDVSGRTVWSRSRVEASEGRVEIDMSRLGSGAYNVIMTDGRGRRSVSKVVKQ